MELPPLPPPPLESREVSQGEEIRSLCSGAPFVLAHRPPTPTLTLPTKHCISDVRDET